MSPANRKLLSTGLNGIRKTSPHNANGNGIIKGSVARPTYSEKPSIYGKPEQHHTISPGQIFKSPHPPNYIFPDYKIKLCMACEQYHAIRIYIYVWISILSDPLQREIFRKRCAEWLRPLRQQRSTSEQNGAQWRELLRLSTLPN